MILVTGLQKRASYYLTSLEWF